ncbi:DivIVA domain-containing protein [Cellulomonas bogoriensis]|uniref:Cell wall synthesis protein Wag31 n=1 Tax=Cellulomonas bogoriensis 69B4 = DSM 16987 TaxID=1386082 RepID=A0A0A0BZ83_9CELL|nr:DivIVA domain-containing protein [Cellulomonas bogoriensis]KGM12499.1 cell division protein DivIVA [Cellulomonas bogoriensis 69B4 = DSM 16987]
MQVSAADVRAVRFQATKFREGYEQQEVDDFLDRLQAAFTTLEAGGVPDLTADEILNTTFAATKYREGYDQDEVDDFLDRAMVALGGGAGRKAAPLDAPGLRAALADLRPRRLRPGYDPAEVDELLTSAAYALQMHASGSRPSLGADDVARARPAKRWWRPGVDRRAVDQLLARVESSLRD